MKLTKKEKQKVMMQAQGAPRRGSTWVGLRPAVFRTKRGDTKAMRRESAALCRAWQAG